MLCYGFNIDILYRKGYFNSFLCTTTSAFASLLSSEYDYKYQYSINDQKGGVNKLIKIKVKNAKTHDIHLPYDPYLHTCNFYIFLV